MKRYKSSEGQQLIFDSYDRLLVDWDVVYEEMDIQTSYGSTHIVTAGSRDKPPVVLLHGTGDNIAMMWIYNIQQLSDHFYVIAIDAIGGSGKSEPNETYYKQFNQTTWLDEVLESLLIETTHIAGVSYGAYLAYYYAIIRPSKVTKIVCMAGSIAGSQFEVMSKMMRAFLPEALFPTEKSCKKLLRKLSGTNHSVFENNSELMNHWYYLLKYFNNKSMMQHKVTIFDHDQIKLLRNKSLFLIGDKDILSYYPKSIKRLQAHQLSYKIIENTGHAINHEQAQLVNTEIINYLTFS
ncbi:MAG: alpha/beta hydrolase [Candidatus Pristimantibacillus lignocellulolyticus]|uniref:Alpha/beta hydrolase n=1 Tax=Candidatus Pristimantibacillus lignocellulolyticus TaxID=2994561 RepID=A0A9J6ZCV6_9BACL|nr:MAG: alpha/beta hydrolase [Candidatus Pristimantibacillus lignocellulolyticus]